MSKLAEVIDSLNDENVDEVKKTLASEAKTLEENNRRLYSRAKKAEGFEYDKGKKEWIKKEEKKPEVKTKKAPEKNDSDSYFGRKAFLETRGIKHPDDQKWVFKEAERLKMGIDDILGMEHAKIHLKNNSDERKAQAGMPDSRGGGSGKSERDVDYHLKKGTTPDDPELANKVIEARMKKESGNIFSDEMFTGEGEL